MTVHELIPTRTGVDLGKAQTVTIIDTLMMLFKFVWMMSVGCWVGFL
jgi:hypothetical protein